MNDQRAREPIAIVGLGCRVPGAADPAAFWRLLLDGNSAIREIPQDRLDVASLFDPTPATPGRIMSKWSGVLDGLDQFDAQFFGIAPREAELVDPQQRLLLEVSWEALEDAGIPAPTLNDSNTGVFVGLWLNEYESRMFRDPAGIDFYKTLGTGRYSASGRLSYSTDCRAPASRWTRRAHRRWSPFTWRAEACGRPSAAWHWRGARTRSSNPSSPSPIPSRK